MDKMNGSSNIFKNKSKKNQEKIPIQGDLEYQNLKKGGGYMMEKKDISYKPQIYTHNSNLNKNISDNEEEQYLTKNKNKNLKRNKTLENEKIKNSFLQEMLDDHSFSKGYGEPLIESYHEIGEIEYKDLIMMSLKLGFISFGGPSVHQELIKSKFVKENKYLTEKHFRQILNLCLVLPGYSSSTFLAAIAAIKTKSILGGFLALIIFNIPSFVAVLIFS